MKKIKKIIETSIATSSVVAAGVGIGMSNTACSCSNQKE